MIRPGDILPLLDKVQASGSGKWSARCPAHPDRTPSLSFREADDGRALVFCHAGCTYEEIMVALGFDRRAPRPWHVALPPRPRAAPHRAEPKRLPAEEVEALWSSCVPVTDDAEATAYLCGRGIPADRVEELDLARALPVGAATPSWARSWSSSGHRLIVPVYNSTGQLASVRARATDRTAQPKTKAPSGGSTTGLVMAEPLAFGLLRGHEGAEDLVREGGLWVAEGEPDFLAFATSCGDSDGVPAYMGITSGSWTETFGALVPAGTVVTIATHADAAGDRYFAEVAATLVTTVSVRRWRP